MKVYLFFIVLAFLSMSLCLSGQTTQKKILFDYDAAGNRILRYVDNSVPAPAPMPMPSSDTTTVVQDSLAPTFRVTVYPNPVQTNLVVIIEVLDDSPQLPTTFQVRLVSIQGAVHYNQSHQSIAPVSINMHNCEVGHYHLTVTRGTEVRQLTILKQ